MPAISKLDARAPARQKGRLAAALMASTMFLPAVAAAQVGASPTPPPVFQSVDEHGVDVLSGQVIRTIASVEIGPGGPGSLSYHWGFDPTANKQKDIYGFIATPNGTTWTVTIGGMSATYTLNSGVFTSNEGDGSSLVFTSSSSSGTVLTYTRADGAVATFTDAPISGGPLANNYKITSLTYPTGEALTYYYVNHPRTVSGATVNVYDVRSVTSSLGYQLRLGYTSTPSPGDPNVKYVSSVVAFDMADETCDPTASSCTLTGTWPSLTYGLSAGSSTLTDATGLTITQTATNTGSAWEYAITRPSGGTETYTRSLSAPFRTTRYTDGKGTWNYVQPALPFNPYIILRSSADGGTADFYYINSTNGRLQKTEIKGVKTEYTYDSKDRVTQIDTSSIATSAAGVTYKYTYDSRGNVTETRIVAATAGTPADIVSTASYPSSCSNTKTCNKPDYTVDANGKQTDYTYDSTHGSTLNVTLPAPATSAVRPQTRYGYTSLSANYKDGTGTMISGPAAYRMTSVSACTTTSSCAGTADEVKSVITYGANDSLLPTSVETGAGDGSLTATTATTYYGTGDVKTVDGPLSGTADSTRTYYDAQRRVTGVIGPDPDGGGSLLYGATRTTYNNDGRISLVEAGTATGQGDTAMSSFSSLESQATDYDAQGRIHKQRGLVSGSTSTVTQYGYTNGGLPECVAVRTNPSTFGSLPSSACTATTTGSYGPDMITQTVYDTYGRVSTITEGVGSSTQATVLTNAYTALNQLDSVTDGEGNKTTFEYDSMGRQYKTRYPSTTTGSGTSSTTDYEQFAFDPAGNVTVHRLRDGTSISMTYDWLNRATLKDLPGSEPDVTFVYDNFGRATSITDAGSHSVTFSYDALGRRIAQSSPLGAVGSTYDLAGRRTVLTWPDGFYVNYDYLANGALEKVRENGATSGFGVLANFSYDNLRRRTGVAYGSGASISYSYDGLSRLTSLSHDFTGTSNDVAISLVYDPASRISSRTINNDSFAFGGHYNAARSYTTNGLNQHSAAGGTSLGYDARGNLTSSGSDSFTYSSENLLKSGTLAAGTTTLTYDPLMRLYSIAGPTESRRFMYDGLDIIAEINISTSNMPRRHIHGLGADEPLVQIIGSGTGASSHIWSHADERGSMMTRSTSTGATSGLMTYDQYGIPGSSNLNRFQYTGQVWLPDLGMYHYKARAYSPTLGRFLQTDPIGYGDGMNLYRYVGNDPVNKIDPLGLISSNRDMVNYNPYPDIVVTGQRGNCTGGCIDWARTVNQPPTNPEPSRDYLQGLAQGMVAAQDAARATGDKLPPRTCYTQNGVQICNRDSTPKERRQALCTIGKWMVGGGAAGLTARTANSSLSETNSGRMAQMATNNKPKMGWLALGSIAVGAAGGLLIANNCG